MERWRRMLPLVVWLGALIAGLALFHGLGRGPIAAPPLTEPGAWSAWLQAREPAVATVAVLRLVVLALAWYLVGATTVGIVARLVRSAGLVRVADALTLPLVRRLLQGALGVTLATAMVGASTAPMARDARAPTLGAAASETAAPVAGQDAEQPRLTLVAGRSGSTDDAGADGAPLSMRLVEQEGAAEAAAVGEGDGARRAEVPRLRGSEPADDGAAAVPEPEVAAPAGADEDGQGEPVLPWADEPTQSDEPVPAAAEEDGQDAADVDGRDAAGDVHVVVAGESLWSIAQDTLAQRWEREPADVEVLGYWRDVIEANRSGLADPDNPDLIFPGDEVVLPAVPQPTPRD